MTEYVLLDCLEVAAKSEAENPAVLIYASHKRFGGGYLNHSKAQEEYCFNNTTLPRQSPPSGFYPLSHMASDGFILPATIKKGQREVQFIFVPAPVWNLRKDPRTNRVRIGILHERAKLIFTLAQKNGVDHLILGGWGCGVFQCPPVLVAQGFKMHAPPNMKITYAFLDKRLMEAFKKYQK